MTTSSPLLAARFASNTVKPGHVANAIPNIILTQLYRGLYTDPYFALKAFQFPVNGAMITEDI